MAGVAGTGIAAGAAWLTWQRLARRALPKTEGTLERCRGWAPR